MKASKVISTAIKELYNPDGITVTQNGGIFNELGHYHMHVVPRYRGQSFANFYSDDTDKIIRAEKLVETQEELLKVMKDN
jgi:diadenosine tetraphosphate (Ap4A) HIT family hydrolase